MAPIIKFAAFFFVLMLLSGEIRVSAVSTNRKLMVDVERESSATPPVEAAVAVAAVDGVEVNNHHAIPRESWDNGGGQTGP